METVTALFAWVMANSEALLAVVLSLHGTALLIVNLTPTPSDDAVLAKAYKVIEFLGGLVTKKAKQ